MSRSLLLVVAVLSVAAVTVGLLDGLSESEAAHQGDHLIHSTEKRADGTVIKYHNYVNRSIVHGTPMEVCAPANLEALTKEAIERWEDALGPRPLHVEEQ